MLSDRVKYEQAEESDGYEIAGTDYCMVCPGDQLLLARKCQGWVQK